ncbi:Cupin domain-containing protein [Cladophialophora immunda]|nr:Cupin domain-containing protein [Cladophialophora immunda]
MTDAKGLPAVKRHLTTNNDDGVSVFSPRISSDPPSKQLPDGTKITFCYGCQRFPVDLASEQDLQSYQHLIDNPPGIVIPNGFACRILDLPPRYNSVSHRTISVNFNVVLQGQMELTLNSGEKRILGPGDSAIQRCVDHSWRNVSSTEWARMAAAVIPAEPWQFGGVDVKGSGVPGMGAS